MGHAALATEKNFSVDAGRKGEIIKISIQELRESFRLMEFTELQFLLIVS